MIKSPFINEFYTIFPAPNAEDITLMIEDICKNNQSNDNSFNWKNHCKVDTIPIKWQVFNDLIKPSMEILCNQFRKKINYTIYNPWINLYKRNHYQEVHDHTGHDLSCVFFVNEGVDFGKFFFMGRYSCSCSLEYQDFISYKDNIEPKVKAGDIMFFSSHLLHGVSSHESDVVRKTVSINFNINQVENL